MIRDLTDTPADRENRERARKVLSSGYSPREKDQQLAALINGTRAAQRERTKLVVFDEWFRFYRRRIFTTARTRAVLVTNPKSSYRRSRFLFDNTCPDFYIAERAGT